MIQNCLASLEKNIHSLFGKPGEGIHSYRIFNIAYLDIFVTMIAAYVIQQKFYPDTKYISVLFYLFLVGILLHRIFGVRTTVDKFIFK